MEPPFAKWWENWSVFGSLAPLVSVQKTDHFFHGIHFKWLTGFLRDFRVMFWGHVLEVFANGICVLAVQNTTPELLRIG